MPENLCLCRIAERTATCPSIRLSSYLLVHGNFTINMHIHTRPESVIERHAIVAVRAEESCTEESEKEKDARFVHTETNLVAKFCQAYIIFILCIAFKQIDAESVTEIDVPP